MFVGFVEDMKTSQRGLRRRPALALTVIATVAVSVGAIAAMAGLIDAVLLRPLPFPESDKIVWMSSYVREPGEPPFSPEDAARASANPMDVVDWAARNQQLEAVAPFETSEGTVQAGDRPVRVDLALVRATIADVLRVVPRYGRLFTEADYGEGTRVLVMAHGLWQNAFGGDPTLVGRIVTLNDEPYEVVGILPDTGVSFPDQGTDIWLPLAPPPPEFANRGGVWQRVIGRVKPTASLETAQADITRVAQELEREYPDTNANRHVALVPFRTGLVGDTRAVMYLLSGAVALVLLIACANVGHLLLVSAQGRQKELAVRAALGARPGRLARLFLAESFWLTGIGGLVGLALGPQLLAVFLSLYPDVLPSVGRVSIGLPALLAALGAIAIATLLAVIPSLLHARSRRLQQSIRASERGSEDRRQRRVRAALVLTQVALSTTLLIGGGLLLRTFWNMQHTDPGFAADSVLTFNIALSEAAYPTLSDEVRFYDQLQDTLQRLPGVRASGTTTLLPLTPGEFGDGFYRVGFDDQYPNIPIARLQNVTPGYLEAVGLPVKQGRTFEPTDDAGGAPVVIVNEELQRRFFPDGALGRQIRFRNVVADVVGVVGDKRHRGFRDSARPEMFFPRAQVVWPRLFAWVAIRTTGDPLGLVPQVRDAVQAIDRSVALDNIATMADRVNTALAPDRFRAFLIGALAVVALLLAAIGLYGLIAHAVDRDSRDIAIRMALGASATGTVGTVLRSVLLLSGTGILLGMGAALAAREWLAAFVSGVSVTDPLTLAVVAGTLLVVAALAAAGPAARASRIDPATALRST